MGDQVCQSLHQHAHVQNTDISNEQGNPVLPWMGQQTTRLSLFVTSFAPAAGTPLADDGKLKQARWLIWTTGQNYIKRVPLKLLTLDLMETLHCFIEAPLAFLDELITN